MNSDNDSSDDEMPDLPEHVVSDLFCPGSVATSPVHLHPVLTQTYNSGGEAEFAVVPPKN